MPIDLEHIGSIVLAVGGLGLAACSLVDASKALPGGGISRRGFEHSGDVLRAFLPGRPRGEPPTVDLGQALLRTLQSHWINGMPGPDQRAVAKSLLKLQLAPGNAAHFAAICQVDPQGLAEVAAAMQRGVPLETRSADAGEQAHSDALMNVLGRFDLALTALLDGAYQRAEQRYRNVSKAWAALVAVVLAMAGGWAVQGWPDVSNVLVHLLLGLLAVPLAPISKDLTSALQSAAKAVASLKR